MGASILMNPPGDPVGPGDGLEGTFSPIDETIRPRVGAMHLIAAVRRWPSDIPPLHPLVGTPVSILVDELPNRRSSSNVQSPLVPEDALKHGQLVCKNCGFIVDAIVVRVLQTNHPPLRVLRLLSGRLARTARIGDVETPLIIEAGVDRPEDVPGGRNLLNREAVGNCERTSVEGDRGCVSKEREADQAGRQEDVAKHVPFVPEGRCKVKRLRQRLRKGGRSEVAVHPGSCVTSSDVSSSEFSPRSGVFAPFRAS
ncbi:MAG: hypothetical protein JW395_3692 [Nitrospira sp.]|nr:hypothetical protein [Nitrospira sp.]